jgi:starvation-inducible outer membrane lipoprotein
MLHVEDSYTHYINQQVYSVKYNKIQYTKYNSWQVSNSYNLYVQNRISSLYEAPKFNLEYKVVRLTYG